MIRRLLGVLGFIVVVAVATVYAAGRGCFGAHEAPGTPTAEARSRAVVAAAEAAVTEGAAGIGAPQAKQVLFGDLHVHTTVSFDAFMISLPLIGGEGAHPPADACDYARFCSALDFWSINDHAEGITPQHWAETIDAIRQCNDVAGDPANPDTVAYLGWEWTQVGRTPEDHFGHKNVVLAGTGDDEITARPISSGGQALQARQQAPSSLVRGLLALFGGDERIHDFVRYMGERDDLPLCDADTPSPQLPADCFEMAETPDALFRKLREWDVESMVIPHGTTWGFYTPPGSDWRKQLAGDMHDPNLQTLLEVYSGHGDSEVYRPWRGVEFEADGTPVCPEPTAGYLPSCWRAGEIIRQRCAADGESADACERRAVAARAHAAAAGVAGHLTVPGARPEAWLDAGQCVDCDEPAFNYRPGGSAQYILALRNFDDPADPRQFRMGLMTSIDNHWARPGTGYKEVHRVGFTESNGRRRDIGGPLASAFQAPAVEPASESVALDPRATTLSGFQLLELERQASFFLTGGLVGVHSEGRDREAIWDAMQRREVYGTSGPRMLLWFDLLNAPGSRGRTAPMGSQVALEVDPIFQVRAVGSFEQLPGCPEHVSDALSPDRIESVCKGECYHPSDRRRPIARIEVVRIRPQNRPDEPLDALIDDPWRRFDCEPDAAGCSIVFTDPEFIRDGRDALYYVRAYEEPAPAINADNVRCTRDAEGRCTKVDLCRDPDDD